jgi:hypothetical protein
MYFIASFQQLDFVSGVKRKFCATLQNLKIFYDSSCVLIGINKMETSSIFLQLFRHWRRINPNLKLILQIEKLSKSFCSLFLIIPCKSQEY